MTKKKCDAQMEVFSRVVGFYSPTSRWNRGKQEEFRMRKTFKLDEEKLDLEIDNILREAKEFDKLREDIDALIDIKEGK